MAVELGLQAASFARAAQAHALAVGGTMSPDSVRRITEEAGALCTPRVLSLRAQMPAMCSDGGMCAGWFVTGCITSIHG
ncbi:MAG: hypothetical protein NZM14_10365 [Thermoflexales bacterium]|nr:hypothetical protein [Thermoflexales bacterium]